MAWYSTGTVNLANGSTAVGGSGTAWVANARKGWAIQLPDGKLYEIGSVNSNTSITLVKAYTGPTANAQAHEIVPMYGLTGELLSKLDDFFTQFGAMANNQGTGAFADGTMGQPGVRFINDADTGLARLGSNLLGLIVGGDDVLRVSATGAQLNGLLTGTALNQSKIDTTPGRLQRNGDFGIGGTLAIFNDYSVTDNSIPTGMYQFTSSSGQLGAPPGVTQATVIHSRRATTGGETQLWIIEGGSTPGYTAGTIVSRARGTGSWSGWVWAGTRDRGSNANGDYIRFSNGLCICWQDNQATVTTGLKTWTYPIGFSLTPTVLAQVQSGGTATYSEKISGRATTSCDYGVVNSSSAWVAMNVSLIAIGFWHNG